MLSQSPAAIKMRKYRAAYRARVPAKPPGKPPNLERHAKLVRAFDLAERGVAGTPEGVAERFGFLSRGSLLKGVKRARRALAEASPAPLSPTPRAPNPSAEQPEI